MKSRPQVVYYSASNGFSVGLYKIFVYFEAVVHESTILSSPPPTCIAHPGAIRLHDYWTVYDSPSDRSLVCYTPYNIGSNNIVCKVIFSGMMCASSR